MKKTIFHFIFDLDVGGAEKNLFQIVTRLENNFNNFVICFSGVGEIGKRIANKNIPVFYLNNKGIFGIPFSFLKFKKLVKKHRPDILSTHLVVTDILGRIWGKILGIPIIICNVRSTHKERKYQKVILLDYLTSFLVNKYTVNSQEIINYYASLYPFNKKKFAYFPNGIELKDYEINYSKEKIRENLGIPLTDMVISCVSNLHQSKGQKYLLEAFEQVYQNTKDVSLLLIGEGKEKDNLIKQAEQYQSRKKIFFLGYRVDVKELLASTDIFVLPTLFEGMSNALLEAMASQCVIITTDIPENKDLIENNKSGVLAPLKNSQKIAQALEDLIDNPEKRKNLGKAAKNTIKDRFEINKIVQGITNFYWSA